MGASDPISRWSSSADSRPRAGSMYPAAAGSPGPGGSAAFHLVRSGAPPAPRRSAQPRPGAWPTVMFDSSLELSYRKANMKPFLPGLIVFVSAVGLSAREPARVFDDGPAATQASALGAVAEPPRTAADFTRDRIRIGAWVSPRAWPVDEDFVKTYSAGGFDWIIARGALARADYRDKLLRDCDRYGVELILDDGAYKNPAVAATAYADHPSLAGTYVTDEPGTDQYDELSAICRAYRQETGGKLPYINLLPMYSNAAQLKRGASAAPIEYYDPDPVRYKQYCDLFCEQFDLPYICTDIYPLNWADGTRATYSGYCEAINVIASSAREHGKDFWCCIQTFGWSPDKRTPTESEFRWQSYCLLSFGCKGLLCWTYAGYSPEFPSLLTVDGKRTNAWYDAAAVCQEMRRISDAFVRYQSLGAFAHHGAEDAPYLRFSHPLDSFPTIRQIDCDDPLLVGCFAAREGAGAAFTVVNMSELEAVKTVEVGLRLEGARVVAWPRGQRTVLAPDADGAYHLTLASGEGVLVEVE